MRAERASEDGNMTIFNISDMNRTENAKAAYFLIAPTLCAALQIVQDQLPNIKVNILYNKLIGIRPDGINLQSRKRRTLEV